MKSYAIKFLLLVFVFLSVNLFADSKEFNPQSIRGEINRLNEIKKTDPERYEKELREYKQVLQKKIQYLKKHNPEKYAELRGERQREEHSHIKGEFERNPDKRVRTYTAYTNRLQSKLLFLKENDPESYERLKERIEQERDKRFKGNDKRPPNPFFEDMHHGNRERKKFGKNENRLSNDMQLRIAEIKDYINDLPPEQQEQARARLRKKLAEKREHFKKSDKQTSPNEDAKPLKKDNQSQR
jgi:hypothetical protein